MQLIAKNLGRKFGQEWIFSGFSAGFKAGEKWAITGNNGSGKSTLLKIIGGCQLPSAGSIQYEYQGKPLATEDLYRQVALVAPYTQLPDELTPLELLRFMQNFRSFELDSKTLIEHLKLWKSRNKAIKYFSSGMKQRLQLGLAFYSDASLLLLDEPSSTLDRENTDWYLPRVEKEMPNRILIISSNQPEEYNCCSSEIKMGELKEKQTNT